MDKKNPKRRKKKDNPYSIYYNPETDKRYITFRDGEGCQQRLEIDCKLFVLFNTFELADLSEMNEYDRHIEHTELEEGTLHKRAVAQPEDMEDIVWRSSISAALQQSLGVLSETEQRRLSLYYEKGLTFKQIVELEGCAHPAVIKSVNKAKEKIKSFFEKQWEINTISIF